MQFVSLPWTASHGPVSEEITSFLKLVRENPGQENLRPLQTRSGPYGSDGRSLSNQLSIIGTPAKPSRKWMCFTTAVFSFQIWRGTIGVIRAPSASENSSSLLYQTTH